MNEYFIRNEPQHYKLFYPNLKKNQPTSQKKFFILTKKTKSNKM